MAIWQHFADLQEALILFYSYLGLISLLLSTIVQLDLNHPLQYDPPSKNKEAVLKEQGSS